MLSFPTDIKYISDMDIKIIAGIVLTAVIAIALFYSSVKEARKSPDQKYKEKQEREKAKKEKHRDATDKMLAQHPGLRAIDNKMKEINIKAQKQIDNDKWVQNFLAEGTKEKLLKKTKQRLINIAKKDLNIELDPSMKKNEMVEKIYSDYHNLKKNKMKKEFEELNKIKK
jgi:hypothetical protein